MMKDAHQHPSRAKNFGWTLLDTAELPRCPVTLQEMASPPPAHLLCALMMAEILDLPHAHLLCVLSLFEIHLQVAHKTHAFLLHIIRCICYDLSHMVLLRSCAHDFAVPQAYVTGHHGERHTTYCCGSVTL